MQALSAIRFGLGPVSILLLQVFTPFPENEAIQFPVSLENRSH